MKINKLHWRFVIRWYSERLLHCKHMYFLFLSFCQVYEDLSM